MITTHDKSLPSYGDGKQQRDWLQVEDNCRGILTVLEKRHNRLGLQYRWARSGGEPDDGAPIAPPDGQGRKPDMLLEAGLRQTIEW
jgi:nucleoside-diphosphate-sugar epimerase